MTSAPCAEASRAASSCLSIIDSWSPDQSVCSNAALTVLDIAPSWGSCRALHAPVPPMLTTRRPERERALPRHLGHDRGMGPRVRVLVDRQGAVASIMGCNQPQPPALVIVGKMPLLIGRRQAVALRQ